MKPIFKSSLIKDVVISYVCMIVFPVMIILGMVFLLAGRYIYRAATESVTVTQQAVLELYKEEMRGSALALSRVVNMNGGTTIQDASGYDTQRQEQAMEQLYTMYQMLAAPEYKILDIHIYRKDGTAIIPKGEMRYSVEELRQKEWYQTALRQPGLVHTSLVEEGKINVEESTFFCFGAGGAGRAMCSVLAYHGAKKIYITDFYEPCAESLVMDINENFAPVAELVHHGDYAKIAECNVVMNASGIGMGSTIGQTPMPVEHIQPGQFYFDACYNPDKTQFLLNAEEKGCQVLNGLGMSLYQGAAQIELWTGEKAPVEAMRKELMDILAESK